VAKHSVGGPALEVICHNIKKSIFFVTDRFIQNSERGSAPLGRHCLLVLTKRAASEVQLSCLRRSTEAKVSICFPANFTLVHADAGRPFRKDRGVMHWTSRNNIMYDNFDSTCTMTSGAAKDIVLQPEALNFGENVELYLTRASSRRLADPFAFDASGTAIEGIVGETFSQAEDKFEGLMPNAQEQAEYLLYYRNGGDPFHDNDEPSRQMSSTFSTPGKHPQQQAPAGAISASLQNTPSMPSSVDFTKSWSEPGTYNVDSSSTEGTVQDAPFECSTEDEDDEASCYDDQGEDATTASASQRKGAIRPTQPIRNTFLAQPVRA
jgi:hypothetical protein